MAFRAFEQLREKNERRFGISAPGQPKKLPAEGELERLALEFLYEECEDLRFDESLMDCGDALGTGAKQGQIPYNLQMDTDRLCLINAVHRFLRSGDKEDAFDVYFCYMEMFLGHYGSSGRMIELLGEFESNASVLLMKHRDHFVHSVYVFVLGLAVYQSSSLLRETYNRFYGLKEGGESAKHFLRYWGLASLFHDIGYPFELPFEQVKSYFGNTISGVPFVAYKGTEAAARLSMEETEALEKALGIILRAGSESASGSASGVISDSAPEESSIHEILAQNIYERLGKRYGKTLQQVREEAIARKPCAPEEYGGFMDHAYFSAVVLFRELLELGGAGAFRTETVDAISAIALHNSMYKFSITNIRDKENNRPLRMEYHPLAYLLMLCDELQCWDRVAYGQNSRKELHPAGCGFAFGDNRIDAVYQYDKALEARSVAASGTYKKMKSGSFLTDIETIVDLNGDGGLSLSVGLEFAPGKRGGHAYLSESSFLHLYYFAAALNYRYHTGEIPTGNAGAQMLADFDKLSLEYKLSNINQAKAFKGYLDRIGCFYSDKPMAYELLGSFTPADMDIIGPLEHERWNREKKEMGWQYGTAYLQAVDPKQARELTRTHSLMIDDYYALPAEEQEKDTAPMNALLRLVEEFDGLRIYRIRR